MLNELLENEIEHVISIHAGVLPPERLVAKRDALTLIRNDMRTKKSGAVLLKEALTREGVQRRIDRIRRLRRQDNSQYYFLEGDLKAIAYGLLNEDRLDEAIEILELIVELFPESVDAHDDLGSAYMNVGNYEPAIRSFKQSLRLYPINSGAFDMLSMAQSQR